MKPLQRLARGVSTWLKASVYVQGGKLFFSSRRGFRRIATSRDIGTGQGLPGDERVWVAVTPGWWLGSFFRGKKTIDTVVARNVFGRWGNQTFQLAHTLTIAKKYTAAEAFLPGNTVFPRGRYTHSDTLVWTNDPSSIQPLTRRNLLAVIRGLFSSQSHLVGTFFHTAAFPADAVTPDTRTATLREVRDQLPLPKKGKALDPRHLVIHIRGDDVFRRKPPASFGQPPLSYYLLVLDDEAWSEVTVVSGDTANPVLDPLLAELKARSLPHRFQSGTLEDDLAFLRSASTLVAGRGTFIPAVTGLSTAIQTVYSFGEEKLFRRDLTVREVSDRAGDYWSAICAKNWANTPQQRELMLNYGQENLEIHSRL